MYNFHKLCYSSPIVADSRRQQKIVSGHLGQSPTNPTLTQESCMCKHQGCSRQPQATADRGKFAWECRRLSGAAGDQRQDCVKYFLAGLSEHVDAQ